MGNSGTISGGLTYTGSGTLYIDGFRVPDGNTTNIEITATRFKIGNDSQSADLVKFGGNLKLTITGYNDGRFDSERRPVGRRRTVGHL